MSGSPRYAHPDAAASVAAAPGSALLPAQETRRARYDALINRARLQQTLAPLPFALALYGAFQYPVAVTALVGGLCVFLIACLRWPGAWLPGIATLLPILDFTPWSGRLYLQEIDLFLLAALAACLWHGHFRRARQTPFPLGVGAALGFFTLAYLGSLYVGLSPFPPRDANAFSNYYSHYNGLRIARGFLWALIFLRPLCLLFRRDRERARAYLLYGVMLGLLGTALAVWWERGVFHDLLYGATRYARLHGLLDFATPYRITGLLSSMHTGGESIDGYLALAWPCALIAILLKPARRGLLALGAVTLPLALYSVVTTFSRASYLALGVSMLAFGCGFLVSLTRRAGAALALALLAGVSGLMIAGGYGFVKGGILALGAIIAAFLGGALLAYGRPRFGSVTVAVAAAVGTAFAAALLYHAQLTSKWVAAEAGTAAPIALGLAVIATGLGLLNGHVGRRTLDLKEFGAAATLVVAVAATLLPALLGYRMEARFSEVSRDIETRRAHWRDGLALAPDSWPARLWGIGLGAFPRLYLLSYQDKIDGLAVLTGSGANTQLQITGGKDVKVTQRICLPAFQPYRVRLKYRLTDAEANLRIRVCRRHLINPTEYNGACVGTERNVKSTGGEWQVFDFSFDIGALGVHRGDLARAPLLVELTNRREYRLMAKPPAIMEFDDIELLDSRGVDYIRNGGFEHGMDHWFVLYDFNHLPWHAKSMFVHLYVEQGWMGLVSFLLLMALVLHRGLARGAGPDFFSVGIAVSLLGFLAIGLVGTMFDEPRVMFLCFLLMFALVADTLVPRPRRNGPRRRVR